MAEFEFPEDEHVTEDCKDLIRSIFKIKPHRRPTPKQILEHKFLTRKPIPPQFPVFLTKAPPDIDWIRRYWPNAALIKEEKTKSKMDLPSIVFIDENTKHIVSKRRQFAGIADLRVEKAANFLGD